MIGQEDGPGVDVREARAAALNYLARREHGCRELEAKLVRRGVDANVATEVVEQLARENLVSDERYVQAFVRSKAARLFGPLKIRADLRQRGIADPLIEQALVLEDGDWQEAADTWAAKRARGGLDRRERARIYRSGKNRGFTHEQMMRALDRLKS